MHPLVGRKQSPEHIAKRQAAVEEKRLLWSPERWELFKQRISNSKKGKPAWNKGISTGVGHPATNKKYNTPEEKRSANANRQRKYRQSNPRVRVDDRISAMMRQALQGKKAGKAWELLVGYTVDDLMMHLESQFLSGMSWENIGEWHIDHIKPRSSFHYESPDDADFKDCWKIENLRPLWAIDNLRKGNKEL